MSGLLSFWANPHRLYTLALTQLTRSFGDIADDLVCVALFTVSSALQIYLACHILRNLWSRAGACSKPFAFACLSLSVAYLGAAAAYIYAFTFKLSTAARLRVVGPADPAETGANTETIVRCISGSPAETSRCLQLSVHVPHKALLLDSVVSCLLQAILTLADGLMVYRCTVVFCGVPVVYVTVIGMLCGSIISWAVSAAQVFSQDNWANLGYDVVTEFEGIGISVFCSVMINLTVTLAISTKVIRARRAPYRHPFAARYCDCDFNGSRSALGPSRIGCLPFFAFAFPGEARQVLYALVKGTMAIRDGKPLLLRLGDTGAYAEASSRQAFAPHIMLLRVVEGRSWSGHDSGVSRPLAFIESNSTGVDTAQEDGTRV